MVIGLSAIAMGMNCYAAGNVTELEVCETLLAKDFTNIEDAPTQVTDARTVEANGQVQIHCQVKGYVSPNVEFVLQLPAASKWNGKYIQMSPGGYGGETEVYTVGWCQDALRRGYACLRHDTGHTSLSNKAAWAYNNLQAEFDYGIRGHYVAALAGKALTEHFYGAAPEYSYHFGCSGGGKQGIVEAQRYPWMFDGIIALEPSNVTSTGVVVMWNALVSHDENGNRLFSETDLRVLHHGAIDACDADDGLKDGIIGADPRTCDFDPRDLLCKANQSSGCLSKVQVEAAQKIYEGPVTSQGEKLSNYFPWYPALPGGELGEYFTRDLDYKTQYWQFMGFEPDPGPEWKGSDFDFDHDYKRAGMKDALINGYDNPDLRNFRAAGGKLMIIQGWEDSGLPGPLVALDYYEMAEKVIGSREATQESVRLYMIPGRSHCIGGVGAGDSDFLSYLEDWVEKDVPPDMIIGSHVEPPVSLNNWPELMNALEDPERVRFTRPHYPYPLQARYRGNGDPDDYRSFEAVEPEPAQE
jgi:feruloyl esterase